MFGKLTILQLKVIFLGDFSFVKIFLKNYRVTMTTTLNTSRSENAMVLSARRVFLHACISSLAFFRLRVV